MVHKVVWVTLIALAIRKRSAQQGGWFFLSDREVEAAGHANRTAFIEAVEATDGTVFTTEPTTASTILTVLCVGRTWQEAMEAWSALGFRPPTP